MIELDEFSLQINIIDTVQWETDRRFDQETVTNSNREIKRSPWFQIFGTTETGEHECLIVHGFFPEIYVNCPSNPNELEQFTSELISYIERDFGDTCIKSYDYAEYIPAYGYQDKCKFIRLFLVQPDQQQQLGRHINAFAWNGKPHHAYEAHFPNFIKFLSKYNLTGFGYIRLKHAWRVKSILSRYGTEVHCRVEDIIVDSFNQHSQLLSHLRFIWAEQRDLRRRLGISSQPPVTSTARKDIIFTQRPPTIKPSQAPPLTQELEDLLKYIEVFDPDKDPQKLIEEEKKTQLEIDSIMKDDSGINYHTPNSFVEGRISQVLQPSMSQMKEKPLVQTIASKLLKSKNVLVVEEEKNSEESSSKEKTQNSQKEQDIETGEHGSQFLKVLFIEVGCSSRGKLLPNPAMDQIVCACFTLMIDKEIIEKVTFWVGPNLVIGEKVEFFSSERELLVGVINYILKIDPDIIVGWNIERESVFYINERCKILGIKDFYAEVSRTGKNPHAMDEVRYIEGRLTVNLWRVVRHQAALRSYTLASVSDHFLGTKFPDIKQSQISYWLHSAPFRFVSYCRKRATVIISICLAMNFVEYYCELSSIIGADFASTYSRGSQFQIESLLIRVSKRLGFCLPSPTRFEVSQQRAPMALPLVMEPMSGFYSDPVLVIDFQSLYPSSIIAYNLDYTSIVGRTEDANTGGRLGVYEHKVPTRVLEELLENGKIINTPNDVLYVTKDVRPGLLPAMLDQILNLRAFIKQTLKKTKNAKMKSILDARQMALKVIAACTYGYTSAHFSGRMPCVELSDSIVECSRHVLEFTLNYIEKNYPELSVLYGDTDSLFVMMPPASTEKCFQFADKLCEEITSIFPSPIRIKIEKIYRGCFLVNKKRYCGLVYETADQQVPTFDVKGLEMKRRDSCPFTARVMTEVILSIIKTKDIKEAEVIFKQNISKLCHNIIPIHELFFARELRLGTYKALEPPGAFVARRQMSVDPMMEPLYGQRLQYIVVSSSPGSRLVDKVVSPEEYLERNMRVCTKYYVEKQLVPALGRVLETMGVDVSKWIKNVSVELNRLPLYIGKGSTVIEQFCVSAQCPLCGNQCSTQSPVCNRCLTRAGRKQSLIELIKRIKSCQKIINENGERCNDCIGDPGTTVNCCMCSGCNVFWETKLAEEQLNVYQSYYNALKRLVN
ncbi:DNA polymerase family B containing protein [Trichomonas vaginalis G3]|uniref:DNA polymerase n=1 Tax=Trichomonas vaginalis (strain ATCC PRA-98 / G3) TaxID=412133 RepID=A2FWK3_TRIV3|nr:DNA polymerase zeta catalytic subunit family [Trichomonas vaginalis G3]EAX90713.1 DNA polymerase family B containing protein [Trichomonas vaginalis G3]KAI5507474.1 DNA polymerase zeta catalytic subunit family [Trichomonas vaginalis G3]|eukprot:XP_001303643.1 DNA polymerase family B containing protein [Trichomonas vaginalis G3]